MILNRISQDFAKVTTYPLFDAPMCCHNGEAKVSKRDLGKTGLCENDELQLCINLGKIVD